MIKERLDCLQEASQILLEVDIRTPLINPSSPLPSAMVVPSST